MNIHSFIYIAKMLERHSTRYTFPSEGNTTTQSQSSESIREK